MDDDEPGLQLVHLLRALTVEFDLLGAEFARRNRLHPTDLRALVHLLDADRGGTTASPGWLAEQLRLDSSSVTALVDRLERRGHVRRERDPADRRRVRLVVEEQAVALGWSFFGPLIADVVGAAQEFTASETAVVERFLRGVLATLPIARNGSADPTLEPALDSPPPAE
jgi:DNA-binding MarR family transcriptional regulator